LIEIVLSGEGLTGGGPKVVNAENPVMDYGPQKMADIRALGPANVVLSTDLGQPGRVNYAQAFHMAMTALARSGFSQAEIDTMIKHNPARFLGLK
jgi:predicted metal-dependent phosphotriesterase family hydrolase